MHTDRDKFFVLDSDSEIVINGKSRAKQTKKKRDAADDDDESVSSFKCSNDSGSDVDESDVLSLTSDSDASSDSNKAYRRNMSAKVKRKQTHFSDRLSELQQKIAQLEEEKQQLRDAHAQEIKTKVEQQTL